MSHDSKLLAYLRLFRAPNVFTAISDVAMGYLVVTGSLTAWPEFLLIVAASSLMYMAGMVLNDVFDIEVDRRERPQRPLPSGAISRSWAAGLGAGMLVGGVALAWAAPWLTADPSPPWWRTGLMASILAGCIVLYNAGAKRTLVGPLVMGSCRFFNILMGMSLHAAANLQHLHIDGFDTSHLMIAGGIGTYIVGVTVFARGEAERSHRGVLSLGFLILIAGIVMLAAFPELHPDSYRYRMEITLLWPMAVMIMSVGIVRRTILAIARPEARRVQSAIKFCLLSLIVLDAMLTLLVCPAVYAVGIIALLAPTLVLGRWVYST